MKKDCDISATVLKPRPGSESAWVFETLDGHACGFGLVAKSNDLT